MLDPPGTMRISSASVVGLTGYVSLSKNRRLGCADMSARAPMRNPRRIPRFTHALTHQAPSGVRSAARMSPRARAVRNSANRARSASSNASPVRAARASRRLRSDMRGAWQQAERSEHHSQPGASLLLHGDEREAEAFL